MSFGNLTLLSLFIHLVSTALTQTAYGGSFSLLRWLSLFAVFGFGGLSWIVKAQSPLRLEAVDIRVAVYLILWSLTVVNADYPLFSSYRLGAHAMIVVSSLVFLPRVLRVTDVAKLLRALKLIVGVALLLSYFRPAQLNIFDDPNLYRGVLGNANSLGHMSAIGCLLFLHGYVTRRGTRWGLLQAAMAGLAGILLIRSGARSSVLGFAGGFLPLLMLYKSRLSRYVIIGATTVTIALMALPFLSDRIGSFAVKHTDTGSSLTLNNVGSSRWGVWERQWEDFQERPLLGWGFGLEKNVNLSDWNGEFTALGVTTTDVTNDVLTTLQSGGVVGLFAYTFMLSLIFKIWIPASARSRLDGTSRRPGYGLLASAYEAQEAFYCLTTMLIVLFEFDSTALAAGNFFAALFWVSLGLSAVLYAMLMYSLRPPKPTPSSLRSPNAVLPAG